MQSWVRCFPEALGLGFGFRVWGFGFRTQGLGLRVWGVGFAKWMRKPADMYDKHVYTVPQQEMFSTRDKSCRGFLYRLLEARDFLAPLSPEPV